MARKKTKGTATLKDIAGRTGYSVNTVSRALRGKDDIAPDTQERIKAIAEEMGYVNNMIASSLRLGYTKTIAVILGDVSNPHFAIMMKEIEEHARNYGYATFLINTNEEEDLELKAIQEARNKNVDGIILCPVQKTGTNIEFLQSIGIPFVLIGRRYENLQTPYVVCNDELGGYQAVKHLLERGHKKILCLSAPGYISSAKERLAGAKRAHEEFQMVLEDDLVHQAPVTAKGMGDLLDQLIEKKLDFTGIFAFSDIMAWSVWAHLQEQGYAIPDQFSLIGFDHIQSRMAFPYKLSTISSYKTKMSSTAVDILMKLMSDKVIDAKDLQVVINTELVLGETVIDYI